MKKTQLTIVVFFLFSLVISAQRFPSLLSAADSLYKKFDHKKQLELLNKANETYPDNWEVLWRLSRVYVDIGEGIPEENEDEQVAAYEKSLGYADKAIKLAPDKSVTYLRKAIANGRIALFKGVFSVAGVVDQVKEDLEKAIELNNGGNEVQGTAHYVLARTHAKISEKWAPARAVLGLGWADIDIAIEEYEKAVKLRPNFMMIYVDYAKAMIEEDETEKAKELLNKALACPIIDEDDSERLIEAKELLKELEED